MGIILHTNIFMSEEPWVLRGLDNIERERSESKWDIE